MTDREAFKYFENLLHEQFFFEASVDKKAVQVALFALQENTQLRKEKKDKTCPYCRRKII